MFMKESGIKSDGAMEARLMVMIFSCKKVRNQLLQNELVYTFRTNRHKLGKDWATAKRTGKKLCDIHVLNEWPVSKPEDLANFRHASGFNSIGEWMAEIQRLNPKMHRLRGFVYLVSRAG